MVSAERRSVDERVRKIVELKNKVNFQFDFLVAFCMLALMPCIRKELLYFLDAFLAITYERFGYVLYVSCLFLGLCWY